MAQTPLSTDVFYSDLKVNLGVHPFTQDITVNTNVEAVKRSIRNIIMTRRGERPYNPNYGTGLQYLLFENMSPGLVAAIRSEITTGIQNFEPRATVLDVRVSGSIDSNALTAAIIFSVESQPEPIVLDLILDRVR
jgi:phage baseplate assembly protein W